MRNEGELTTRYSLLERLVRTPTCHQERAKTAEMQNHISLLNETVEDISDSKVVELTGIAEDFAVQEEMDSDIEADIIERSMSPGSGFDLF